MAAVSSQDMIRAETREMLKRFRVIRQQEKQVVVVSSPHPGIKSILRNGSSPSSFAAYGGSLVNLNAVASPVVLRKAHNHNNLNNIYNSRNNLTVNANNGLVVGNASNSRVSFAATASVLTISRNNSCDVEETNQNEAAQVGNARNNISLLDERQVKAEEQQAPESTKRRGRLRRFIISHMFANSK